MAEQDLDQRLGSCGVTEPAADRVQYRWLLGVNAAPSCAGVAQGESRIRWSFTDAANCRCAELVLCERAGSKIGRPGTDDC
jgi:hypothetical protein